jgi:beta-lactamase regulating signal transducer with metallopeptidase domain
MSSIDTLNALAVQWFDIISKQSLYAALMAGFVWAVLKLWRPRHPIWAIALWSLVLIRFILPVESAAPWSARALLERSAENWLMHDFTVRQKNQRPLLATEKTSLSPQTDNSAAVSLPIQKTLPLLAVSPITSTSGLNWMTFLLMIWAVGAGYFLIQLKKAYTHLNSILSRARPLDDKPLSQAVELWRATLSVRRSVCLRASADCDGAFTTGIFAPVIVLPEAHIQRLAERDISAIIGHEMAHIKGLDSLWLSCEQILRALFFFHPAIWIATSKLDAAREELRDLDMLHAGPVSVQTYASTLLSVLKNQHGTLNAPVLGVAMGRTAERLKARLILIKDATATLRPSRWLIGGATLMLAAIILPMSHSAISKAKPSVITPAKTTIVSPRTVEQFPTPQLISENDPSFQVEADSEYMDIAEAPSPPESPAPPEPPIHNVSYTYDNTDLADIAETTRDAEQTLAEAEREAADARLRAQDQSVEAREEFANAEREVERARLELKWANAEAARARSEARKAENTTASPETRRKYLVVYENNEIRCGSAIDTKKNHKIIINGKKYNCTGSLTSEDINDTSHDKGYNSREEIIASSRATLIFNRDQNGNSSTTTILGDGATINIADDTTSISRAVQSAMRSARTVHASANAAASRALDVSRRVNINSLDIKKQALTRALTSLSRASDNLRAHRSSTLSNLQNSGLSQTRIDTILKSIDQSIANINQQSADIQRDLNN